MRLKYDFSGYATKNDLKCSDGRVIRRNAFKDCDGMTVPLVWQHQHNDPDNVLGHSILENRDDGVYCYCVFNDSEAAKKAKLCVEHGDINSLSVYANKLKQNGSDVLHGVIREVSLVLAGANPGAFIDQVSIAHSDGELIDDAIIYTDALIEGGGEYVIEHADKEPEDDDEPKSKKKGDEGMANTKTDDEKTVQDVFDELTEQQQNMVYYLIAEAINSTKAEMKHSDEGDDKYMRHNVFESNDTYADSLTHADIEELRSDIMSAARRYGSLKEATMDVLEHSEKMQDYLVHTNSKFTWNGSDDKDKYGIQQPQLPEGYSGIDILFPEATAVTTKPEFIKRNVEWVNEFMTRSTHKPFSRIKSVFADITDEEARARGYIKGKQKKDQIFPLLKRVTTPQTIYKRQRFDRDDLIDVTTFDLVPWIKSDMRVQIDEEIARAALIGDGRETGDESKISEDHIRPVMSDDDLYTIKYDITDIKKGTAITADNADAIIDAAVLARPFYEGSGMPICFMDDNILALMLVQKDDIGHRLYKSADEIASLMGASKILPCSFFKGLTRTDKDSKEHDVYAVILNPVDYAFGTDRGGALSMFDDFDINFNQQIYLMETRLSGALIKPKSAIVIESANGAE